MNPIDDGGPAFPTGPGGDSMHGEDGRVWHQYPATPGMSLRDWFAGQALVGLLSNSDWMRKLEQTQTPNVVMAYRIADEMMFSRKRGAQ